MAPSTLYAAVPGAPKVTSKVTSKGGRKAGGTRPGGKKKGTSTGVAHRLLGMLILMALVMGGLFTYRQYRAAETPHPDAWDPRVTELVAFVETTRGLTFEHPVFVDFLDDATFVANFADSEDAPLSAPAEQRAYENELLDALGLTNGGDVAAAQLSAASASTPNHVNTSGSVVRAVSTLKSMRNSPSP